MEAVTNHRPEGALGGVQPELYPGRSEARSRTATGRVGQGRTCDPPPLSSSLLPLPPLWKPETRTAETQGPWQSRGVGWVEGAGAVTAPGVWSLFGWGRGLCRAGGSPGGNGPPAQSPERDVSIPRPAEGLLSPRPSGLWDLPRPPGRRCLGQPRRLQDKEHLGL